MDANQRLREFVRKDVTEAAVYQQLVDEEGMEFARENWM